MNKLISVFGLFLIFSCGNSEYKGYDNKVQSTWIIHEIDYESATTATYYAKTTDTTDLNEVNTWFADTIGAFKAGDTLIFAQKQFKNEKSNTLRHNIPITTNRQYNYNKLAKRIRTDDYRGE